MELKEWKSLELWRSVIAECLATFFYVFLACAVTLNWTPNMYRVLLTTGDLLQISLAFGLALSTLTQCFGHISGAHINPAITIATLVTCKISLLRGVLYILAQCGGGVAGAALLYGVVPEDTRGQLGCTTLHPSLTPAQGFGVEFLMTFVLTFTFFATIDPKRASHGNEAIPLGLTMTLLHIVGYRLTGSSCNPARSLGPAFIKNTWSNHWIYWAGPVTGAVVAALLYQFVFAQNKTFRSKSCSLTGLKQQNDGQTDAASFTICGHVAKRKQTSVVATMTTPSVCGQDPGPSGHEQLLYSKFPWDLTGHLFRGDSSGVTYSEPPAPAGSLETDIDTITPQTSHTHTEAHRDLAGHDPGECSARVPCSVGNVCLQHRPHWVLSRDYCEQGHDNMANLTNVV